MWHIPKIFKDNLGFPHRWQEKYRIYWNSILSWAEAAPTGQTNLQWLHTFILNPSSFLQNSVFYKILYSFQENHSLCWKELWLQSCIHVTYHRLCEVLDNYFVWLDVILVCSFIAYCSSAVSISLFTTAVIEWLLDFSACWDGQLLIASIALVCLGAASMCTRWQCTGSQLLASRNHVCGCAETAVRLSSPISRT